MLLCWEDQFIYRCCTHTTMTMLCSTTPHHTTALNKQLCDARPSLLPPLCCGASLVVENTVYYNRDITRGTRSSGDHCRCWWEWGSAGAVLFTVQRSIVLQTHLRRVSALVEDNPPSTDVTHTLICNGLNRLAAAHCICTQLGWPAPSTYIHTSSPALPVEKRCRF